MNEKLIAIIKSPLVTWGMFFLGSYIGIELGEKVSEHLFQSTNTTTQYTIDQDTIIEKTIDNTYYLSITDSSGIEKNICRYQQREKENDTNKLNSKSINKNYLNFFFKLF